MSERVHRTDSKPLAKNKALVADVPGDYLPKVRENTSALLMQGALTPPKPLQTLGRGLALGNLRRHGVTGRASRRRFKTMSWLNRRFQ
jgi:hypothetical protein